MINTQLLQANSYTFTIYSVFPGLTAVLSVVMAFVVLIHENFSKESKALGFLLFFSAPLWFLGHAMMIAAANPSVSLFWIKVEHIGAISIPLGLLFFSLTIRNIFERYKILFWIFAGITAVLYYVLFTDLLVSGAHKFFWGYYPIYSPFKFFFIPIMSLMIAFNFYLYGKGIIEASSTMEEKRMRFFFCAFLLAAFSLVDWVATFKIPVYPFGYAPVFIFLFLLSKGIWQYNLVDITPVFASAHIIKNMEDLLIITDMNGYVRLMNPSSERFFGVSERSITNQHIHKLFPDKLLESNDTQALKQVISSLKNKELSFEDLNKNTRSVSISGSLLKNTSHKAIGFVFTANDRTEYKKALDNIKTAYKTTQTILEKMPVGIMILDMDKNIESINDVALKIMGLNKEEEIVGKPCLFKLLCYDEKTCCPLFESGQERVTSESDIIGSGNKKVSVLKTALQATINDKKVILEAFVDITQRKLLADQLNNYKEYLENQVEERTVELQTANKKLLSEVKVRKEIADSLQEKVDTLENFREETIERESEMIEIKKMINGYCERLNRPKPYRLSFLKEHPGS